MDRMKKTCIFQKELNRTMARDGFFVSERSNKKSYV